MLTLVYDDQDALNEALSRAYGDAEGDMESMAACLVRAAPVAPPGYVLVPVEPTPAMYQAIEDATGEGQQPVDIMRRLWKDACAAAPALPSPAEPGLHPPEADYERRVKELAPEIGMARAVSRAALSSSAEAFPPVGDYERRVKELAPTIGMARAVSRAALGSQGQAQGEAE